MNKLLYTVAGIGVLTFPLQAEILNFDLSPAGTSAATGLSPANEVPAATGTGSGGEALTGITFDTDTNELSVALAYGSLGGFTNLTGDATAAHLHGPAGAAATAPPIHDFFATGQHLFAPAPGDGGVIVGKILLTPPQAADLLGGLNYINIHTSANPDGEIRGQLVHVTNSAPTVSCPESVTLECTSHDGAPVELGVDVEDVDGDELYVVYTIDGVDQPEIVVPSGGVTTSTTVPFVGELSLGEHVVSVAVSDGVEVAEGCEFTVTIVDTVPPIITSVTPNPASLWPPNHKMKTVKVKVEAEDICGDVTTRIVEVSSNEDENATGDGNTAPDWEIISDEKVKLRAERSGNGDGRIYTIVVEATDEAGNTATTTTEVTVPHSKAKKEKKPKKVK
ncbi:CHRD domain-containing protein [Luteolibacter marinus]|uniref:CHRD domain-containing protein n=1 Tax=Luteolibacter marinus TaxID=2776705 RepID=UPI001866E4D8|nr:CHRD domain-containing protein [Luteolibacter marinus]